MKIAVPTDVRELESAISPSFGRASYFCIYNTDSKEYSFKDNSAAVNQGGAGIKAAQSLVDERIDALLTPRCGENAAEVLHEANIEIYTGIGKSVIENIEAFKNSKLVLLEDIHAGFHNHGEK